MTVFPGTYKLYCSLDLKGMRFLERVGVETPVSPMIRRENTSSSLRTYRTPRHSGWFMGTLKCQLLIGALSLAGCDNGEAEVLWKEAERIDQQIALAQSPADCMLLALTELQSDMLINQIDSLYSVDFPRISSFQSYDSWKKGLKNNSRGPLDKQIEQFEDMFEMMAESAILYSGCLIALRNTGKISDEDFRQSLTKPLGIEGLLNR